MTIDAIPQGNPASLTCRWCEHRRTKTLRGALICMICDTRPDAAGR